LFTAKAVIQEDKKKTVNVPVSAFKDGEGVALKSFLQGANPASRNTRFKGAMRRLRSPTLREFRRLRFRPFSASFQRKRLFQANPYASRRLLLRRIAATMVSA
jgi:hypothetical protein